MLRRCQSADRSITEEQCWNRQRARPETCEGCFHLGAASKEEESGVVVQPKAVRRGTCSECLRPDKSLQARGMCSKCYQDYLKKKKDPEPEKVEEKVLCSNCNSRDAVAPSGLCGACAANADLRKNEEKAEEPPVVETQSKLKRGTCSACNRPDLTLPAKGMCSSCYQRNRESTIEDIATDKQHREACLEIPTEVFKKMANDLNAALRPKVTFREDVEEMREEAYKLRLNLLDKVHGQMVFWLGQHE